MLVSVVAGYQLRAYVIDTPDELAQKGLLIDDAYFYSVIAENFVESGRLSLDSEMHTNGFQPLWMIIQISLKVLFRHVSSVKLLSISTWVCYIIFCFLLLYYLDKSLNLNKIAPSFIISILILLNPFFQDTVMSGLETPLMLCLLILTLIIIDYFDEKRIQNGLKLLDYSILALIPTLVFYARTDLFWVTIIISIWLVAKTKKIFSMGNLLFVFLVFIIVAPYLLFNYIDHGAFMPISGRVKSFYLEMFYPDFSSYIASDEWHGPFAVFDYVFKLSILKNYSYRLLLWSFVMIASLVIIVIEHKKLPKSVVLLGTICMFHLLYMMLFYRELRPYTKYYFLPEVLLFIIIIYTLMIGFINKVELSRNKLTRKLFKTTGILLFSLTVIFYLVLCHNVDNKPKTYWVQRLKLAQDIETIVPEGEKVSAFWPGLFAQFSGRDVVPLDGIIGSNEYFDHYIKTGKEIEYIKEKDIKYLAIYIETSYDKFISQGPPKIENWANLGLARLWDAKQYVKTVKASRPVNSSGAGWFLIEFDFNYETNIQKVDPQI